MCRALVSIDHHLTKNFRRQRVARSIAAHLAHTIAVHRSLRARARSVVAHEVAAALLLAEAAVIFVAREIRARVSTLRETLRATLRARALVAHESHLAELAALAAVESVRLQIDAATSHHSAHAHRETRGTSAHARVAHLLWRTEVTAAPAVRRIVLQVATRAVAHRLSGRASGALSARALLSVRARAVATSAVRRIGRRVDARVATLRETHRTRARARSERAHEIRSARVAAAAAVLRIALRIDAASVALRAVAHARVRRRDHAAVVRDDTSVGKQHGAIRQDDGTVGQRRDSAVAVRVRTPTAPNCWQPLNKNDCYAQRNNPTFHAPSVFPRRKNRSPLILFSDVGH